MTTQVPTNGFVVPPLNVAPVPPVAPTPGYTPPPDPLVTNAPAPAPVPAVPTASEPDALAAAVAALTEAMKGQAPAPEAIAPAPQSLNSFDPNTLEDPTLRSMANAFKALGNDLDLDRIFTKALDSGNPELLDLAYLREKGGANAKGLEDLAVSIVTMVEQKSAASTAAVFALAGGEANWNASVAAFNVGAPAAIKMAVSQMIDSGKEAAVKAAAELVVQYAKNQGFTPNPAALVATGAGISVGQGLSKLDFQAELRKLNPQDRNYNEQRDALFARRTAGKQQGL